MVADSGTRVLLRYGAEDEEVAQQARRALRTAVPVAERWGALAAPVTITIHPTHEALEAAALRPDHPWLRACARADSIEVQSTRSWSRGWVTDAELAQLLAHELTHCVLYQTLRGEPRLARSVPGWFWEGMATTTAGERFAPVQGRSAAPDPFTATPSLYGTASPLVYATADHAFRYLVQRYGQARIRQLLARLRDGADFQAAFQDSMGIGVPQFEDDFRRDSARERTQG